MQLAQQQDQPLQAIQQWGAHVFFGAGDVQKLQCILTSSTVLQDQQQLATLVAMLHSSTASMPYLHLGFHCCYCVGLLIVSDSSSTLQAHQHGAGLVHL